MSYDNSNSGMLARNLKKKEPQQPDYKGNITVGGVEYWLSAWINEGKPGGKMEGRKYFGLSLTPKNAESPQGQSQEPTLQKATTFDQLKDDIPGW
jgi:hypothetical protein